MHPKHILRSAMAITSAAMLIACGGSDGGSNAGNGDDSAGNNQQQTRTLTAAPSLGRVEGATVRILQADDATLLGEAELNADGTAEIEVAGEYDGPFVLELSGDDDSTYYDEAAGTMLSTGPGELLHAIAPSGATSAAITALTEIAYRRARDRQAVLSDDLVLNTNESIRQVLAPELTSLLTVPLVFDANTAAGELGDNPPGRYALRLAALARLGAAEARPAITVARQLADDIVDGTLDGEASGVAIEGLVYAPLTFANDLERELADFAGTFGNSDLASAVGGYPRVGTTLGGSGDPGDDPNDGSAGNGGSGSGLTASGDGSALAGANGATGTVMGTTYTFTGSADGFLDPAWTILPGDGSGVFSAPRDAVTRWEVRNIDPQLGTQSCGAGGEPPSIFLAVSGVPYLSDECTIEVDVVSDTEVEGRFAARLLDASDGEFGTVTDGYFRLRTSGGGNAGSGGDGSAPAALTDLAGTYRAEDTTLPEIFGTVAAGHMTLDLTIGEDGSIDYVVRDKDDGSLLFDETIAWDGVDDEVTDGGSRIRLDIESDFISRILIEKLNSGFAFHLDVPLFIEGVGNNTRDAQWNLV